MWRAQKNCSKFVAVAKVLTSGGKVHCYDVTKTDEEAQIVFLAKKNSLVS